MTWVYDLATGRPTDESTLYVRVVGTSGAPITNEDTTRPDGAGCIYWICANGVTPTNAVTGDLIFNADA